uniref:Uncharacterized protein n=1 Tax=Arundo donax TaxID=35708 RepID=A0A0A9FV41_ARUDO
MYEVKGTTFSSSSHAFSSILHDFPVFDRTTRIPSLTSRFYFVTRLIHSLKLYFQKTLKHEDPAERYK